MKIRWKVACLLAVIVLDIVFAGTLYYSFSEARNTLFLPADAGGEAKEEVRKQFSGDKQIALTFDDGPHSVYTPLLLDGLRKRGVHATFFLLGENVIGKEAIVKQMQEDGHLIGNHGYSHVQMNKEAVSNACKQIEENNRQIEAITGVRPQYLRPPYGSWNEELECTTNMTVVLWDVDTFDTLRQFLMSYEKEQQLEIKTIMERTIEIKLSDAERWFGTTSISIFLTNKKEV